MRARSELNILVRLKVEFYISFRVIKIGFTTVKLSRDGDGLMSNNKNLGAGI